VTFHCQIESYEYDGVKRAVRESLDLLGGMSAFVKPGDRVLLKVNLLIRRRPEKVTTTHPSLARALAELVIEAGGRPLIGDSPGGYHFYNRSCHELCNFDAVEVKRPWLIKILLH